MNALRRAWLFAQRFTFGHCPYCGRIVRARGFAPVARHVETDHPKGA